MSLAIEIDNIAGVLLRDGWHEVVEKSFTIDAYEYVHQQEGDRELLVGGGTVAGVSSTGAAWREAGGGWVACPVPSILAVKYRDAAEASR